MVMVKYERIKFITLLLQFLFAVVDKSETVAGPAVCNNPISTSDYTTAGLYC